MTLTSSSTTLLEKIETRQAVVGVIGLGYVGLPLAVAFGEAGFRTVGIDLSKSKVDAINRSESYIGDISSERLESLNYDESGHWDAENRHNSGSLSATTDYTILNDVDAVIICVPTPLSKIKDPDLSYIISASDEIAKRMHPGMLIVLESTTYPGSTEELILPRLKDANGRSYEVGSDFFVAFSPERIDPGRKDWTVLNTPKVIGGVTPSCLEMAMRLYKCAIETVVPVSSPKVAEMVKLLENTFRAT